MVDLRRFATTLPGDVAAIRAGPIMEHSNSQTEGQINRLQLIGRTM